MADDDPGIRRLLQRELSAEGFSVHGSAVSAALQDSVEWPFDLLILDIDSPGARGTEAIRIVRRTSPLPIVALSSRNDGDLAAEALECGADDYMQKPFSTKELLARVTNALRHRCVEQGKAARVMCGGLEIDLLHRRVSIYGQQVRLPHKSYEVLRVLAEKPGQVVSHSEILKSVWGPDSVDRTSYLRVAIRELRRKLEADPARPCHIGTETHVGYRLNADPFL